MACVAAAHVTRILKGGGGRSRLLSFFKPVSPETKWRRPLELGASKKRRLAASQWLGVTRQGLRQPGGAWLRCAVRCLLALPPEQPSDDGP